MQRKQNATRSGCKCERDARPDERGGRQHEKMRISAVRKNQCAFSVRFLSSPALSISLSQRVHLSLHKSHPFPTHLALQNQCKAALQTSAESQTSNVAQGQLATHQHTFPRGVVGGIALKGEWQRAIGARRPRHCESARLTLNDICLFFAELRLTTIKCSKRRSNNNNNINNNSIK